MTHEELCGHLQLLAIKELENGVRARMQQLADSIDEDQRELALLDGARRVEFLRDLASKYEVAAPSFTVTPYNVHGFPKAIPLGK